MQNGLSIAMKVAQETRSATDAFETLFRQHQHAVYSWIFRMVRDTGVAEDLTVETFWHIYRAWPRFDPQREFAPWARRIATRVALDWLRAQPREHTEPREFFADLTARPAADPAVVHELRDKIAKALHRLPPKLRATALLAIVEECPQKEIAAAFGISISAVKLRVFRAMRLLRRDLERQGIKP